MVAAVLARRADQALAAGAEECCAANRSSEKRATDWIKADLFDSCVKKCAKEGAAQVFLTEDKKMLSFDTESVVKAHAHMGHRVKVTGTAANGVLRVDSIASIDLTKE